MGKLLSQTELTAEEVRAARIGADWCPACLTVTHLVLVYSWTHLFISFLLGEELGVEEEGVTVIGLETN